MLANPSIIPAYLGATSRLFTGNPDILNPILPTDKDKNKIAHNVVVP